MSATTADIFLLLRPVQSPSDYLDTKIKRKWNWDNSENVLQIISAGDVGSDSILRFLTLLLLRRLLYRPTVGLFAACFSTPRNKEDIPVRISTRENFQGAPLAPSVSFRSFRSVGQNKAGRICSLISACLHLLRFVNFCFNYYATAFHLP